MTKDIVEISEIVHRNALAHGFHPKGETRDEFIIKQMNNLHDEVSELHSAWRAGQIDSPCDKADKMEALGLRPLTCLEEELADIIIRALDISKRLKVDIHSAICVKHAYNVTRPYKHGKKI